MPLSDNAKTLYDLLLSHFKNVSSFSIERKYRSPTGQARRREISALAEVRSIIRSEEELYRVTVPDKYLPSNLSLHEFSKHVLTAAQEYQRELNSQRASWTSPENKLQHAIHKDWWKKFLTSGDTDRLAARPAEIFLLLVVADRLGLTAELGLNIDDFGREVIAHPFKYLLPNGIPISIWAAKIQQFKGIIEDDDTRPHKYGKLDADEQERVLTFPLGLGPVSYLIKTQAYGDNLESYNSLDEVHIDHCNLCDDLLRGYLTGDLIVSRSALCPGTNYTITAQNEELFDLLISALGIKESFTLNKLTTAAWTSAQEFLEGFAESPQMQKLINCFLVTDPDTANVNILNSFATVTGIFDRAKRTMELGINTERRATLAKIVNGQYRSILGVDAGDDALLIVTTRDGSRMLLPGHPFNAGKTLPVAEPEIDVPWRPPGSGGSPTLN